MNPEGERALDDMLAELRATSLNDQVQAALDTLAATVAYYIVALVKRGIPLDHATALAADLQQHQLGHQP